MSQLKDSSTSNQELPVHIGIIMDGNGRWAKRRGLPRSAGHKRGAEAFSKIAQYCQKIGVQYLTVYAFSTENWKRPQQEVDAVMQLLREYLQETCKKREENVRLCFLGDPTPLAPDLREQIAQAEQESAHNTGFCISIALNYGGREEILRAARLCVQKCLEEGLKPEQMDENFFSKLLYTAGKPDPDLIIRPSGECRTSNFLPWQTVYSELVFMDVLWPDFTPAHLDQALHIFSGRSRRFGGIE